MANRGGDRQVAELARQQRRVELAVEEQRLAGERPDAPLVGDELEGLSMPAWASGIGRRAGLAQRVAGIPDHVADGRGPRRLAAMRSSTMASPRWVPAGTGHRRDDAGDLRRAWSGRCSWSTARRGPGRPGGARSRRRGRRCGCPWPSGARPGRRGRPCTASGRRDRGRRPWPSDLASSVVAHRRLSSISWVSAASPSSSTVDVIPRRRPRSRRRCRRRPPTGW